MKTFLLYILLISSTIGMTQTQVIRTLDGRKLTAAQIDSIVKAQMETANVHGLSLSILNNNKTVYKKAYGYKNKPENQLLDTAAVLYAASFSKAVFAFLALKLVEDKTISLDRPLYQYLKQPLPFYEYYADLAVSDDWRLLTPRMCLSHTTGLPNSRWIDPISGNQDTVGKMKIYFTPGTRYAYSGEGMKLLQLVIEEITQKTVEALAIEKVFRPFGMNNTGYIWYPRFDSNYAIGHLANNELNPKKKRTTPVASGSMVTTIGDYSRFLEKVMQGKGLTPKLLKEMLHPQIKIHSKYQFPTIIPETTTELEGIQLAYGFGWGLLKSPYGLGFFKEGHDDAWRHYNINFPKVGTSIVIMTNSENGEYIFKELLQKLIGDTFTPWKWHRYYPKGYVAE